MPDYILNTPEQQREMLATIGLPDMDALFADIPASIRLQQDLDLPPALAELDLAAQMRRLSGMNRSLDELVCFLGAGAYDHFIPAVVKSLVSRQEFYTAYTPYQPEISQGTLQAIFEYQSMICELTGMDLANASMYDGASALAEAALMACQQTRRHRILAAANLHPESREVLETYACCSGQTIESIRYEGQAGDPASGRIDLAMLAEQLSDDTAAVIVQNPNFFGVVEDLRAITELVHARKALLIVSCDPISLALLESPGKLGADIVVGEGQSLGNSLNFGGPYLGFFAAGQDLMRKMPGRIVGETTDANGRRCYVLTIQTREQHIRRDKATSNICTNQALNALTATIYLSVMGPQGLRDAASLSLQKAHVLRQRLLQLPGFSPAFAGPFIREFTVRYQGDLGQLNKRLLEAGFVGGLDLTRFAPDLANTWLLAVTEKRSQDEIDRFVDAVARLSAVHPAEQAVHPAEQAVHPAEQTIVSSADLANLDGRGETHG